MAQIMSEDELKMQIQQDDKFMRSLLEAVTFEISVNEISQQISDVLSTI